ncbi:uncharacterized protein PV06_11479 [Exophiala oligosperma]|uniref:Serine-threonine/tyrosine-protein kinase catalytic domain-containing protein n=1 Tax=Exophiala oligosperma TaxID=215243 RepID=A0A0D2A7C3_9EURO|nr:uncharacterized protein PV06_11479 [Exophiala oligosperma]KIW36231.1 hypothetical protein PV06_11479 [Exophiala oligosperma]
MEKLSPATDTGRDIKKGIGKQIEKATEPGMLKPSASAHRQTPPGARTILLTVRHESPWKMYKQGYELKFEDFVTVAVGLSPNSGKFAIKNYKRREGEGILDMLDTVRHEKFIRVMEVFEWEQTYFAVFEHVFVSLEQVVACPAYPTERQLVAILAQILEGLCYLSSIGLQHGTLACSNVLLKPSGDIVPANQEYCCAAEEPNTADVRAVGFIAMELMQKYVKDDGAIGIENPNRWPGNSPSVGFLSMTTSAESVTELQQHNLLQRSWRKEDLVLLEELASFSVRRAYRYFD